ncbi:MAG TPA: MFS transporter [Kofleriaceae bacterium]|nr:MFS transporter [Kofleriaceae bacterium]
MLSRRVAWTVAIVATLTMTVSYIDRATLAILAPSVTKALDISETEYGWLTSAFSVAYLVATPLAGWWIDRVGARRGLVASVLAWSAVAALHCVVPGFGALFALRIALGLAEGPSFPGAAQVLQRVMPPGDRSRGFGVLFTGSSMGSMIVPLLAGALFAAGGWRFAFFGTAALGLLWIPLWIGATRLPGVRAVLDAGAGAGPAAPRATFGELVGHPLVIRALIAIFAAAPISGFAIYWGSKYLHGAFGVPQEEVGRYLWLPQLAFDAGAVLLGDLAARQRRAPGAPPRLLVAIAIAPAAGLALAPHAATPWEGTVLVGIAMIGGGAIYTLVTADLLSRMPPACVSFAGGILAGAQSLALIVMNPLVGAVVDRTGSYDPVTVAIGLWAIPGTIVWLAWRPAARFEPRA